MLIWIDLYIRTVPDDDEVFHPDDPGYASRGDVHSYKKRTRMVQHEDNDEMQEAEPDTECQQAKVVGPLVPIKDEARDADVPLSSPTPPALSPSPLSLTAKGRPKAGDYDLATRQVLLTAIGVYCAILLTETPFPTSSQEIEWAKAAWQMARQHHDSKVDHDITLLKLVCHYCAFLQMLTRENRSWHEPATYVGNSSPGLGLLLQQHSVLR